jgi:hypothetical protein
MRHDGASDREQRSTVASVTLTRTYWSARESAADSTPLDASQTEQAMKLGLI